jgi:hypothetical protein
MPKHTTATIFTSPTNIENYDVTRLCSLLNNDTYFQQWEQMAKSHRVVSDLRLPRYTLITMFQKLITEFDQPRDTLPPRAVTCALIRVGYLMAVHTEYGNPGNQSDIKKLANPQTVTERTAPMLEYLPEKEQQLYKAIVSELERIENTKQAVKEITAAYRA